METPKNETKEAKSFRENYEVFMAVGRSYVGTIFILEDKQLTCQAKVLFQIISSLSFKAGYCYATNEQLAEKFGLGLTMVKKYLSELEKNKVIKSKKAVTRYGIRRQIFICFDVLKKRYLSKEKEKSRNTFRGFSPVDFADMYPDVEDY